MSANAQLITAPDSPKLQLVAFDGFSATIKWEKSEQDNLKCYEIYYRHSDSINDMVMESMVEEITLRGLKPGCTYSVVVVATLKANELRSRSNRLEFITAPVAPTDLTVQLFTDNSVSIRFEDLDSATKKFEVTFRDLKNNDEFCQRTSAQFLSKKLEPGRVYDIFVQAIIENPFFSEEIGDVPHPPCLNTKEDDNEDNYFPAVADPGSESSQKKPQELYSLKSMSKEIWTYPGRVEEVKYSHCSNSQYLIEWQAVDGAHSYEVKWTNSGENSNSRLLSDTNVMLTNLDLGSVYTLTVAAINEAGMGQCSKKNLIQTEPPMPTDIAVKHHELFPHTSLMVSFKEITTGTDASYVITAQCVTQPSTTRAETKTSIGLLEKLIPGASYKIFVTAKQGDLLSKKAYYPDFIQTYPGEPNSVELEAESNDRLAYVWKGPEVKPKYYKVTVKANGTRAFEDTTTKESFTIEKPKSSTIYKISVAAVNDAGCGEASESDEYVTAPAAPMNVTVWNNPIDPKTSFIVKYEDPDPMIKQYKITTCDAAGNTVGEIKTREKTAVIDKLKPGNIYKVLIIAMFREKESPAIQYP